MLSVWEKESYYANSDVIIAGSGFVGLWSAYYLKKKQPGLKITIVERGVIPIGASTRNAGFACFGSVTELMKDVSAMGEDKMLNIVEMRYRGLSKIRKVFKKRQIDYVDCGGYELISSVNDERYKELGHQVKWLNNVLSGLLKTKKIFRFSDEKISSFGFAGISHMISNRQEGCLHPGKLSQSLYQKVQGMGVNIITGTDIINFDESGNGITLFTDRGIKLKANRLLVCTNAFARQLLPELDILPARGQVMVTAPIPSLKIKGAFHYDEGFYYFRNYGKRLLIGGARNIAIEKETTEVMDITENIQRTLEDYISRHLLPGVAFEITDRWSGIMGVGPEKMPIIKKVSSNVYCAVRMSGMGVALAPVAAETVTDLMLG